MASRTFRNFFWVIEKNPETKPLMYLLKNKKRIKYISIDRKSSKINYFSNTQYTIFQELKM